MSASHLKKATETATADSGTALVSKDPTFTAPRASLKRALTRLTAVADHRSTMPALADVAIRVTPTGTTLIATDLNVSLTVETDWRGDLGGACVPVKGLSSVVASMPEGDARISLARSLVRVACGGATATLESRPDRDFPKVPSTEAATWSTVSAAEFSDMFDACLPFVCRDETRFHLNGVFFESSGTGWDRGGSMARTVATDGHRLAKRQHELAGAPTLAKGVIVPAKGAQQIVKLLGSRAKDTCQISVTLPCLHVRYQGMTLSIRLIDAVFPPYDQVIPKNGKLATVDRKALIGTLTRCKPFASETRGVSMKIGHGALVVSCETPGIGGLTESLTAHGQAAESLDAFKVGANPKYLIDALDAIDDRFVTLAFGDELCPIVIRGTEHAAAYPLMGAPLVVVVMPMRV